MSTAMDQNPPVFIGGAGRSGTSLLRSILNSHPNIAIGGEFKATPFLVQTWAKFQQFQPHLQKTFHLTEEDINSAFRDLIASLLDKFRREQGKKRIGEKTPNNVFVFGHLHRIFPQSPLIHVIRDGRDVVRSLLNCDWTNQDGQPMAITDSARSAAQYWVRAVESGITAGDELPSDIYLEVRYEELVTDPETIMKSVCSCIKEPWDPSLLEFYENPDEFHPSTQRKITDRSVGKWATHLNGSQKEVIKEIAGELLIKLGYAEDFRW